jgi:hypothetical protein
MTTIVIENGGEKPEPFIENTAVETDELLTEKTGEIVEEQQEVIDDKIDDLKLEIEEKAESEWEQHSNQIATILIPITLTLEKLTAEMLEVKTMIAEKSSQNLLLEPNAEEEGPLKTEPLETVVEEVLAPEIQVGKKAKSWK